MNKGTVNARLIHIGIGLAILMLFAGIVLVITGNAQEWINKSVLP